MPRGLVSLSRASVVSGGVSRPLPIPLATDVLNPAGALVNTSRVSVMPPLIDGPPLALNAPFDRSSGSVAHPVLVRGDRLRLTWQPVPEAAAYDVDITGGHGISVGGPLFFNRSTNTVPNLPPSTALPNTRYDLPLRATAPLLDSQDSYALIVRARDARGWVISESPECFFRPLDAVGPLPLTLDTLRHLLPPGVHVTSLRHNGEILDMQGTATDAGRAYEVCHIDMPAWFALSDAGGYFCGGSASRYRFEKAYWLGTAEQQQRLARERRYHRPPWWSEGRLLVGLVP